MKKYLVFVLLVALAVTSSACFKPKPLEGTKPKEDITVETKESVIKVGDEYIIELEGNATTGYLWNFSVEFDSDILEYLDYRVEREDRQTIVGAPEMNIWTFRAHKEGYTQATLLYRRPWELGVEPERTYYLKVTVEP
jgi:predicted secreted protein